MTKYCGEISVGAVDGGGTVSAGSRDPMTGHYNPGFTVPVAVELISFRIGTTFFRKIRLCQAFVSQFVHPGDHACIYVFKQLGITNVIIGIKYSQFPSYAISRRRMVLMVFAQYLFGVLLGIIPALILLGWLSPVLAILATFALPTYGAWTLVEAYKEMSADFAAAPA